MPREQINYPDLSQRTSLASVPESAGNNWRDSAVHVGWNKDGEWVQVALEADPEYLRFGADNPTEMEGRTTVWTPVLTREEVNKLIRALRKARDQAYGSDA